MKLSDILMGVWAVTPEIYHEIQGIYARHMRGDYIDIKAIEERLGRPLANERKYMVVNNRGQAIISLEGVMAKRANLFMDVSGGVSTQIAMAEFKQALDDPAIKSILLSVDSPGGTVDGTLELVDTIKSARGQKPIMAFIDGYAASGAYWVASAADKVYLSTVAAMAGSIGTLTQHKDFSKQLEQEGVHIEELMSGKFKSLAPDHKPLSEEGRMDIQGRLDYFYSVFVSSVADNRDLAVASHESWADGRLFIGQQAIEAGLVDGVSTFDDLLDDMADGDSASGMMAGGSLASAGGCGGGT